MNSKEKLLSIAFEEIYLNGYHATSVDKILKKANMNKGSMYHFFKSKKELVLASININLANNMKKYETLLELEDNIIEGLLFIFKNRKEFDVAHGCKLNNLVQELSCKDADFKTALEKVYTRFEEVIEEVLKNAIKNKEIQHKNSKSLALFVVASFEGCLGTGKKSQNLAVFSTCICELEAYLKSLRK